MDFLTAKSKEELLTLLWPVGQEHLLDAWDKLDADGRRRLQEAMAAIDFTALRRLVSGGEDSPDWAALAKRARQPRAIQLNTHDSEFSAEDAQQAGEKILRAGKVGFILVAGGEGTRLGFAHPKGLFPIGPVSQRTLLQVLVDKLLAVAARYSQPIPLYVMTSPATHDALTAYFAANGNLGLPDADVRFFRQGTMPAVDAQSGKVLLADRGVIAMSPDGHGGMLAALSNSGCLEEARRRGIELFFYGQVDNPLLTVCEPTFIGYHLLAKSEMTTQVIRKRFPQERVGNVVDIDERTRIIEYIDLPAEAAEARDTDGSYIFWAGNTAVHVFDLPFLSRAAAAGDTLPVHAARKKVPFVDTKGQLVQPAEPNAWKFERFIFDLLPHAQRTLVVEVDAAVGFAPVKNANGAPSDTPASAQAAMIRQDAQLLRAAGAVVADDVVVEVNPRWALDSTEARAKIPPGIHITGPTYFV